MNDLLFIIDTKGDFYFDLIYIFVFLFSAIWLLAEGSQRKINAVAWVLAIAATWFLFIAGTKIFTYSAADFKSMLLGQHLPPTYDKVLFGGLFLSITGFIFLKRILRLQTSSLDAFAILLPLAIGIQRIGCLLAGCCHGIVTDLSWGVQYRPVTLPHYHQFQEGLLDPGQYYSLPVHPTQLYELVAGVLVAAIMLGARRYIKAPGNTFTGAVVLYCFFRFFIEFYRDAAAHAAGGTLAGDLKTVQWLMLLAMTLLSTLFLYRERTFKPVKDPPPPATPALAATATLLLCLVIATWSLKNWFSYAEFVALHTALLPAMAVVSVHVFKAFTVPQYRWLTAAILIISVFLMSQAFPAQKEDSATVKSYTAVKIGYGTGDYYNSHNIGTGSGCDRVSNTGYFHQEYAVGGASYAITRQKEEEAITYGVNAYGARHTETDITNATTGALLTDKIKLAGVNPFFWYDTKWLGIGGGLHVGNLFYTTEDLQKDGPGIPESGGKKTPVYPQLGARVGPTHILFGDLRLADHFPSPMPGLRYQVSVGSGFGLKNGTFLKVGSNGVNAFMAGNFVINEQFVIEPLYLWGRSGFQLPDDDYKQRQFSLGLHYRFNFKEKKVLR